MNELEALEEQMLWDELCRDPLYPCARCTSCKSPRNCQSKACVRWRGWWMMRFLQIKDMAKKAKKGKRTDG